MKYWVFPVVIALTSGPSDAERAPNKLLGEIIQELEGCTANDDGDAFTLYLYRLSWGISLTPVSE